MSIQRNVNVNMVRLIVYKVSFCFILLFSYALTEKCDTSDLIHSQCPEDQLCDENTNTCQCRPGFKLENDTCVNMNPRDSRASTPNTSSLVASHNSGSIVAGILIPLVLILLVIYIIYVSRKYKLVNWIRRKLHQRNNNYDEFMIGQDQEDDDDPPLR